MREVQDVAFADRGFVAFEGYAEEADDAAGGDQSRGVEGAGRDFAFGLRGVAPCLLDCLIDEPADDSPDEDGQRSADGEIGADGE